MVWDSFKKSTITILVIYKMATMIRSCLDNGDFSSLDKNELENSGILGNLIYSTIFSLVYTGYFNI